MRHVFGVVAALAMSAALFFGGGFGVARIAQVHSQGMALTGTRGLVALAAVAGTGLLLGILLAAPVASPLGAGLPGIALLAWSALLALSPSRALRLLPLHGTAYATGFRGLLVTGVLALAGAAMIVPLFVPSRWRRRSHYLDDIDAPEAAGLLR